MSGPDDSQDMPAGVEGIKASDWNWDYIGLLWCDGVNREDCVEEGLE